MATKKPNPNGKENQDAAPASALLPFQLCKQHGLPHTCERSLKIEAGQLFSNRYVLGVPAQTVGDATFKDLIHGFGFPNQQLLATLKQQKARASTIYLGFEETDQSHTRRLYFEYWDEVVYRVRAACHRQERAFPRWPMGVGYKWTPASPGSMRRTNYQVRPMLTTEQILDYCRSHLPDPPSPLALHIPALLRSCLSKDPSISPVYLEAEESNSARKSFDLCLHRYSIPTAEIREAILNLASEGLLGAAEQLRLRQIWPEHGTLTHLSAGRSATGNDYLCLYSMQDP